MVNKKIKTAFSALLAAIAVMCFSVAFVPARADAAAAEANDFSAANGGLESADGALPEGWYFKEKSTVAVDTEVYAEGKNSLRVTRSNYTADFQMNSTERFPVEGGKTYRFSYKIKSVNCDMASAVVKATVYNDKNAAVAERQSGETILNRGSEPSGWTEIYVTRTLPSDAVSASVSITVTKGAAEFWLDDVTVREEKAFYEDFSAVTDEGTPDGWTKDGAVTFRDGSLALGAGASAAARWNTNSSCIYELTFGYQTAGAIKGGVLLTYYDFAGNESGTLAFAFGEAVEKKQFKQTFTVESAAFASIAFFNEGKGTALIDDVVITKTYDPRTSGSGWEGAWVCYPAQDVAYGLEGTVAYYRYTFELSEEAVSSATLQFTADDTWKCYINGEEFVDDANNGVESWANVSVTDVAEMLRAGTNVFAFEITNITYYTGVLFDMSVLYSSGKVERFYSDASVVSELSENVAGDGWRGADFDDSAWKEVYVIGKPPVQPWKNVVFVDNSVVLDKMEIKKFSISKDVVPGEQGSIEMTVRIPQKIEENIDFRVYFWGKYSSDSSEERIPAARLTRVKGNPTSEWKVNKDIKLKFTFVLPDYIEKGSYMVQFDPSQISVTGDESFVDNKIRGYYFKAEETEKTLTHSEVKKDDSGTTRLYIDGEAVAPMLYMREQTTVFQSSYVENMSAAGVKLVCLPNTRTYDMNKAGAVWIGPDMYNFDPVDDVILETLEGASDVKLMFHLDADPPTWWLESNPGERAVDSNGGTYANGVSYASEKWREDVSRYYKVVIEHILSQPYADHIFAVKITAGTTVEWQQYGMSLSSCGDYSPAARNAFRAWLTEKYGSDAALRAAWGDESVTLATAEVPVWADRGSGDYKYILDGKEQRNVIDYHLFYSDMVTDSILALSKAVKEACGFQWIVGTYNGYISNSLTYEANNIVNASVSRLLVSDYVDFFCAPICYDTRMSGMSGGYMTMVDSILNAGKLFFMECDERTVYFEIEDMEPYLLQEWGKTYTLRDTIEQLKRDFANVLVKGAGLWWYDMYGGWFDDPEIYNLISVMVDEMEYSIAHPPENLSRMAWVIDDDLVATTAYNFDATYAVLQYADYFQQEELAHVGKPYDMIYLSDLEAGTAKEYDVYLINAVDIDETEAAALERIKKNGVTIVWYGIPGIYAADGSESAERISEIVGMDIALTNEALNYSVVVEGEDPLTAGAENCWYGKREANKGTVTPTAYVTDKDAAALGRIYGSDLTGLARKQVESADGGVWTSVYSSVACIPARILKNALTAAGGHVYCETEGDVVYANSGYVAINSPYGGRRTVNLESICDVYDVYKREYVAKNVTSFSVDMEANSTRLFKTVPPGTVLETPSSPDKNGLPAGAVIGICAGAAVLAGAAVAAAFAVRAKKKKKGENDET